MKRKILYYGLGILALLFIAGAVYFYRLSIFPGEIGTTPHKAEAQGVKTVFRKGFVYRYPGMPPLCEVAGTHYEMGLQYGVLLRPEILSALESYKKILRWQAVKLGVPYRALAAIARLKAKQVASRLPKRFHDEYRGIADGAGIPVSTVRTISMFYDVGEGMCTGVLMKGGGGTVIQGRNQDATGFGGEEIGKMTVIVRYRPEGYHAVTQFDWPLFMGIETGYNDKGLAFAEETLKIKNPNPDGFSIIYLARIALEECSSLDELSALFDKYPVVGAYGAVWSDRDQGRGMVSELTARGWAVQELTGSLLWNFNRIYDKKLEALQHPRVNIAGGNRDRDHIASGFARKAVYTVKDAVNFLRAVRSPEGIDYSWYGSRHSVCNSWAQQMVIFDPAGDGAYVALGQYYAARQRVYHVFEDFSKQPEPFMDAVPVPAVVEEAAKIENMLLGDEEKLPFWTGLAKNYPNDANAQFMAAYHGFKQKRADLLAEYAPKAFAMNPKVPEYRLYAGLAALHRKEMEKAVKLLEGVNPLKLYPEQDIYRLYALEKAASSNQEKSGKHKAGREALLAKYGAAEYYESKLLPLLDQLSE